MEMRRSRRRSPAAALGAALVLALPAGSPAIAESVRPAQAARTITASTTDLAIGTEVTVSGTGCVDPATGSGVNLSVGVAISPPGSPDSILFGLGGPPSPDSLAAVAVDGSWSISTTIAQPLPSGPQTFVGHCLGDAQGGRQEVFRYDPLAITTSPPPVTGFRQDGAQVTIDNPCKDQTAAPPFTPEIAAYLYVGSNAVAQLDPVTSIETGTLLVTFRLPDPVVPGSYRLEVRCVAHRVLTPLAIFTSMVEIASLDTQPAAATASPAPTVATPADPVAATPNLTG